MKSDHIEYVKWSGCGALAFTVLYGLYLLGVTSGAKGAEAALLPQLRVLTQENNKLKRELIEIEAQQVGAAALEAAGRVLECGDVCAQEVDAALEGCTLLLCGEVRK